MAPPAPTNGQGRFRIGIDIGGTFTDLAIMDERGGVHREKAFTTPGDWAQGILDGLSGAAERHFGLSLRALLARVSEITHGTTIVTNVIAQMNGQRVGLIATKGFGDTLRIARSARQNTLDLQVQTSPPQLVAPQDILEVEERIDSQGRVVVPLDAEAFHKSVAALVESGIEALAVSLVFSFENPAHERAIRDLVRERYPDLPLFLSSDVHPVIREYERMVTTVLNAYVSRGVSQYLAGLQDRLNAAGITVPIGVMQCTGGVTSIEDVLHRPLLLLASGPVGGVIASRDLAARLSLPKVICADMGGTSFDTALIEHGRVGRTNRAEVERLKTGLTLVDVISIGTGGGSIAHLDVAKRPQLGPRSAGAKPGPIAYRRGGTQPTTTDIAVTLNLLSPEGFLGGRHGLDAEAARATIERDLGRPLGLDVLDVCRGYYRIGVAAMAQAVRAVTVERGRDPRDFVLISYGGASGLFIAEIAKQIGIGKVVVPEAASVFSALGMLCGELSRTNSKTVNWKVTSGDLAVLERARRELLRLGRERLGQGEGQIEVSWEADLKFGSQAFELTVHLDSLDTLDDETRRTLLDRFREAYEGRYGKGTHWLGAEHLVTLVNLRATTRRRAEARTLAQGATGAETTQSNGVARKRTIFWPERTDVAVTSVSELDANGGSPGPLIVEAGDTTIYVPPDWRARRDDWRNLHLERGAAA